MRRDQMARDLASLANEDSLFTDAVREKLGLLQKELRPLAARYDVVVANPPYMGSNNANKWLSGWMKKQYPDTYRDLCTCFVTRGFQLSTGEGYVAFITSDTCMYISSFERMRKRMISESTIVAFIDTRGTNAHPDVFDANAGWVFFNRAIPDFRGSYFKLSHPIAEKEAKYLEALANPDCGWFYKAGASGFSEIPGSPIAYWASDALRNAFSLPALGNSLLTREGMATADNDRFLRYWYEVGIHDIGFDYKSSDEAKDSGLKWFPYQKGGEYRKWYGNNDYVVNWQNDGEEIRNNVDPSTGRIRSHNYNGEYAFKKSATWSALSSSDIHVRYSPAGYLYDSKGAKGFAESDQIVWYSIALINSSSAKAFLRFLAPTLDFKVGDIAKIPNPQSMQEEVAKISSENAALGKKDWDTAETSWDFKRDPLV